MLVAVAVAAAMLLAAGVTVAFATGGGEDPAAAGAAPAGGRLAPAAGSADPDSARGRAELAVASLNAKDFAGLRALACAGTDTELALPNPDALEGIEFEAVLEDVEESGEWATARIRVTAFGRSEVAPPLYFKKDGSTWCISTR